MLGAVNLLATEMIEVAVFEAMSSQRHYGVFPGDAQALTLIG